MSLPAPHLRATLAHLLQAAAHRRERLRYRRWIRRREPVLRQANVATLPPLEACDIRPRISILVPLCNTPARLLHRVIASVQAQTYARWELCGADDASDAPGVLAIVRAAAAADPRIRVAARPTRGHIAAATNSALALATGDFVALLDHDDELHPEALARVVQTLNRHPAADLLYTDEDKIDDAGRRFEPIFKPDWNRTMFLAFNLINHLGVYRKAVVDRLGGFREGFDGSQDYDLALRVIDNIKEQNIIHIPEVLYHWRATAGSVAGDLGAKTYAFTAARRAIVEHGARRGGVLSVGDGFLPVLHKTAPVFAEAAHPVTLILADAVPDAAWVRALMDGTRYGAYSILMAAAEGAAGPAQTRGGVPITCLALEGLEPSAARNRAAAAAGEKGRHLVFLAPGVWPQTPDWLAEMVAQAVSAEVGAVGARLVSARGRVRHAGYVLGAGGVAAHACRGWAGPEFGRLGRARVLQEVSGVSGACLLTSTEAFRAAGGFRSDRLPGVGADLDYCLRLADLGLKTVWTPFAEMRVPRQAVPELRGAAARTLRTLWGDRLKHDPWYNPNYRQTDARFRL